MAPRNSVDRLKTVGSPRCLEHVAADHFVAQNDSMEVITGDCGALVVKEVFSEVRAIFPMFNQACERLN